MLKEHKTITNILKHWSLSHYAWAHKHIHILMRHSENIISLAVSFCRKIWQKKERKMNIWYYCHLHKYTYEGDTTYLLDYVVYSFHCYLIFLFLSYLISLNNSFLFSFTSSLSFCSFFFLFNIERSMWIITAHTMRQH